MCSADGADAGHSRGSSKGVLDMQALERNRLQSFLYARDVTERSLLLMYYADQLTPQEISLVMDLPLGEVVRRLASLIAAARAALTDATGDEVLVA